MEMQWECGANMGQKTHGEGIPGQQSLVQVPCPSGTLRFVCLITLQLCSAVPATRKDSTVKQGELS